MARDPERSNELKPDERAALEDVVQSRRFLATSRTRIDVPTIATWNDLLVREFRLLAPIDLQALVVPVGSKEPMVRLPMLLSTPDGLDPDTAMPPPFDPGKPRAPGVHLHWAMPDALLRGVMDEREGGAPNPLALPALPDRWVVLRLVLPAGAAEAEVRGWVLEADRATALPLDGWTEGSGDGAPSGVVLDPTELTGTVGGSPAWSGVYDAVGNRFAFHDPLDDVAPGRVDGNAAAYLVAGWWSDPARDPLDAARSSDSLTELLDVLRWRLEPEFGDSRYLQELNDSIDALRSPLGLATGTRFASSTADRDFAPIDDNLTEAAVFNTQSPWAIGAGEYFVAEPWHLRSSLLHGAVYGVPLDAGDPADWAGGKTPVGPDNRPDPAALRVALGEHDGDVLGALSTVPGTTPAERRDAERLLEAFAAQKINRLGDPDGLVEIETEEHAGGFASQPGGIAGTDRFEQRAAPGQAGGTTTDPGRFRDHLPSIDDFRPDLQLDRVAGAIVRPDRPGAGRARSAGANQRASSANPVDFAFERADLEEIEADRFLSDYWGRTSITRPATEPRVVERPAPRFTFPADPMVAVQGAGRSLRHANDGKASPDGKLTCRWPAQIVERDEGMIEGADLIASLGNGSIPPEVLSLAREVVIGDPYHVAWMSAAVAATTGLPQGAANRRLLAEAGLRFGVDAVYDGSTQVFGSLDIDVPAARGRAGRAGLAESDLAFSPAEQAQVGDRLLAFSIRKGTDIDPVGVTCWSQPWVPLWLEWEVAVDPPDRPTVAGWQLGATDLDPIGSVPTGTARTMQGRALLTTGAATTLQAAVDEWLAAEDQRDAADPASGGEADEETEAALASLARAVTGSDLVTAALDSYGRQLLGFAEGDHQRRFDEDGELRHPAPVQPPVALVAGRVRLTRARLVDAFGRTLTVPLGDVAVTVRDSVPGEPGSLAQPPRITRPARWRLRFVGAATPVGRIGTEARVDQVDRTLQVNPVAGFLLPDHLDESIEVFDTAGNPLGELLTEPVGGGVTWEIAPGRAGPPSVGPGYGLESAQRSLGLLAAGMIRADSDERGGGRAVCESALAAFLRAIDTTLWTVDSFATMGGEHAAGVVGRPVAVVRAQVTLELRPPDRVDLSDPEHAAWWAEAERSLAAVAFPVRIGELTRLDDGVLGFFVDDDYSRFRPVDRVVAELAAESGRNKGQLGLLGRTPTTPVGDPIIHPYVTGPVGVAIDDSDTISVHLGQTVTLTLLMNPAGLVHVTSGILPRFSKALARDWTAPGLARIAPALRTGPVLVETDLADEDRVRLPRVSVFGTDQDFWWRDTPGSWRSDAILAATQSALLPDTPAQIREGWVRARPPAEPGTGAGGALGRGLTSDRFGPKLPGGPGGPGGPVGPRGRRR
jgi:hypothetical protein